MRPFSALVAILSVPGTAEAQTTLIPDHPGVARAPTKLIADDQCAPAIPLEACGTMGREDLRARVAARYEAALAVATADRPEAVRTLDASQEAWLERQKTCVNAGDPSHCVMQSHLAREGALVARYDLEAPVARTTWDCGGEALSATFYGTELPAALVRFRGEELAAFLVPTTSGSTYLTVDGRSFREKGEEAVLVWPGGEAAFLVRPEGQARSCTLREIR